MPDSQWHISSGRSQYHTAESVGQRKCPRGGSASVGGTNHETWGPGGCAIRVSLGGVRGWMWSSHHMGHMRFRSPSNAKGQGLGQELFPKIFFWNALTVECAPRGSLVDEREGRVGKHFILYKSTREESGWKERMANGRQPSCIIVCSSDYTELAMETSPISNEVTSSLIPKTM